MGWQGTDPVKWIEKVKDAPRDAINKACFKTFTDVVLRTPVDQGAARGGWLCSLDQPEIGMGEKDKEGGKTISKIAAVLETAKGGQTVFLTSSIPYIRMLEFGGYGKAKGQGEALKGKPFAGGWKKDENGEEGEKKKKKKGPSKITADGFSIQAPEGMVGLAMQNFQKHLEDAINTLGEK